MPPAVTISTTPIKAKATVMKCSRKHVHLSICPGLWHCLNQAPVWTSLRWPAQQPYMPAYPNRAFLRSSRMSVHWHSSPFILLTHYLAQTGHRNHNFGWSYSHFYFREAVAYMCPEKLSGHRHSQASHVLTDTYWFPLSIRVSNTWLYSSCRRTSVLDSATTTLSDTNRLT